MKQSRSKRLVAAALANNPAVNTAQAFPPDQTPSNNNSTRVETLQLEPQALCFQKENDQILELEPQTSCSRKENDQILVSEPQPSFFNSQNSQPLELESQPSYFNIQNAQIPQLSCFHKENAQIPELDPKPSCPHKEYDQIKEFEPQPSCSKIRNASSKQNALFRLTEYDSDETNCSLFGGDDDSVADPNYAPSADDDISDTDLFAFCEDILSNESDNATIHSIEEYESINDESTTRISTSTIIQENNTQTTEKILFVAEYNGRTHITSNFAYLVDNKAKMKHPIILRSCEGKCRRDCCKFSEIKRITIYDRYWDMKYPSRRGFLNKCVHISEIKRRRTDADPETANKLESRYYYLPLDSNNDLIPVCKRFFLDTLGFKTDGVITELSKAVKKGQLYASLSGEKRGGNRKVVDRNIVQEHINSYHPTVSHYRRYNAPNIKYLPNELTVREMHADFLKKHPQTKCSDETYRKELKTLKISFNMPKGDKCDACVRYTEEQKKYSDESLMPVEVNRKYMEHKTKADQALKKYKLDAAQLNSPHVKYFSMDLQKVIMLPIMPQSKEAFFGTHLIAFNLTFAPINKKSPDPATCVLWHEGQAGREARNIVDAIVSFIKAERDCQHLHLWADNCTAQNKNWTLYTALITITNCSQYSLESITVSYLTKGHTHMTADSVHGNIERKMKKQGTVYDFEDFKNVVQNSRNKLRIIDVTESRDWPKKKRVARAKDDTDPLKSFTLNKLVEVKFISGSKKMFYKTSFDNSYTELDFLMKKHKSTTGLPPVITTPRGITSVKKEAILKDLVPLMPETRRAFWHEMPINNAAIDLQTGGQLGMEEDEM